MTRLAAVLWVALWSATAAAQPAPSGVGTPAAPAAAPSAAGAPSAPAPSAPSAAPPSAAPAAPPSEAQIAPHLWDVDRVRCSDLLHASDEDRAAAAMFYYGYLAARAGIHVINTGQISDNIAKVMKECEATPGLIVPQAFRRALSPAHR
jgi:hypothetical protein